MQRGVFDYEKVEKIIGIKFKDKKLLQTAFTHSSFANEHKVESNERLEFLGDSVLGVAVTMKLFKDFSLSEGDLSKFRQKLVSEEPLAFVVEELGLDGFILKGKGESKNKVDSKAIKADLFEAIVGAICLDSGFEASQRFVLKMLESVFREYGKTLDFVDAKTKLQERLAGSKIFYDTQKFDLSGFFEYRSVVKINGVVSGSGTGHNKKTAEQEAAKQALLKITKE
ncbi:MAG: ribonuclease III [Clostridia bacterium]|nr:ribonuclease III [Clostridia bacterium]